MNFFKLFKSIYIYLLLCYGKNLAVSDTNELETGVSSDDSDLLGTSSSNPDKNPKSSIELPLNKNESTAQFDYVKNEKLKIGTYTPKEGVSFNLVKYGGSGCSSSKILWECEDGKMFAKKVVFDGIGTFSTRKRVTLLLEDGSFKHYYNSGNCCSTKWAERTNKLDLSVKKCESNFEIECLKDDKTGVSTYMPRYDFVFKKVYENESSSKTTSDIWESKESDLYTVGAIMKVSEQSGKDLALLLTNGNFMLFHKKGKKDPWQDNTPTRYSFSKLNLLSSDDSVSGKKVMDVSKYKVTLDMSYTYEFNPSVSCVEIVYDNKSLWKHDKDKHGKEYPVELFVDLMSNHICLKFKNSLNYLYKYTDDDSLWKLDSENNLTDFYFSKVVVVTADDENGTNPTENDADKYDLEKKNFGFDFKFKENVKCIELKYDQDTFWKFNKETGHGFPKSSYYDVALKKFFVQFSEYLGVCNFERCNYFSKKTDASLSTSDLKILTLDDSEHYGLEENNTDRYTSEKVDRSDSFLKYLFKDDSQCAGVKYGDATVWEYCTFLYGKEFPVELLVNFHVNYIVVKFKNHLNYLYVYADEWEMESENNLGDFFLKKLEVVTADDLEGTNESVNDSELYDFQFDENAFNYRFKDEAKCVEARYEGKVVWRYSNNPSYGLPRSLHYDTDMKMIFIQFKDFLYSYFCRYELLKIPGPQDVLSVDRLKIVTLDDKDGSIGENADNRYSLTTMDRSCSVYKYEFTNSQCVGVNYGGVEVWKHDNSEHGAHHPTTVYFSGFAQAVMVWFNDEWFYSYKYSDDKWELKTRVKDKALGGDDVSPFYLKLVTAVVGGEIKYRVNDRDSYSVMNYDHGFTYQVRSGFRLLAVKYSTSTVWMYSPAINKNNFPRLVHFDIESPPVIKVQFDNKEYYAYEYSNGKWELNLDETHSFPSTLSRETYEASIPETGVAASSQDCSKTAEDSGSLSTPDGVVSYVSEDDQSSGLSGTPSDQSTPEADQQDKSETATSGDGSTSTPPAGKEGTSSAPDAGADQSSAVQDSSSSTPTAESSTVTPGASEGQTPASPESGQSTPKTPSEPSSADSAQQEGSEAPISGDGSASTPAAGVEGASSDGTQSQSAGGQSQPPKTTPTEDSTKADSTSGNKKNTPVEVDIKKTSSTNEFDYSKNGKIGTYTAKQDHAFSKVYQKKGSCNCCGSDTIIWEADRQSEYASIVVVDGIDSNTKTVTIHLPNNKTRTFNKPGRCKSWSEVTPSSTEKSGQTSGLTEAKPTVQHPSDIKIITEDPSDSTRSKENDTTQYELKKYGDLVKFEFKDEAKCIEIKKGESSIWKRASDQTYYTKEIYYNTSTDLSYIGRYRSHFVYSYGNDWRSESGTTDKKISNSKFKIVTDGSTNENDTNKYDETNEGSFVKCQFKNDAKCTELKYDNHTVYKHDTGKHGGKHPKVLYFHKSMKVVFVNFDKDAFDLCRLGDDNWESETLEKMREFEESKLKVFTPDPSDASKSKENDTNKFDKKTIDSLIGYVLKGDVKYIQFKLNDEHIFKYAMNSPKNPKLKEIYFILHTRRVLMWLEDKCLYLYPEESKTTPTPGSGGG